MRKLIYIPTLHDWEETVSPATPERQLRFSKEYKTVKDGTDILWESIHAGVSKLGEDFSGFKVFSEAISDNFPIRGTNIPYPKAESMTRIVLPIFGNISGRQVTLTVALGLAGATMVPTEEKSLHTQLVDGVTRYEDLRLKPRDGFLSGVRFLVRTYQHNRTEKRINRQRDEHYATVINENLHEGEQGIFIAGVGHHVLPRLPQDIVVQFISPYAKLLWEQEQRGLPVWENCRELIKASEGQLRGKERF